MNEHDRNISATADLELRDPVCGMVVSADTPHRHTHDGEDVLFCSAHCKTKFAAAPEKCLKPTAASPCCSAHNHGEGHGAHAHHAHSAPVDAPEGVKWTCPMHPEIVRDGPGSCPICGMALEPMTPTRTAAQIRN